MENGISYDTYKKAVNDRNLKLVLLSPPQRPLCDASFPSNPIALPKLSSFLCGGERLVPL